MKNRALLLACMVFGASLGAVGAELPPAIEADRALIKAERQIDEGAFSSALSTLDRIVLLSEEHEDLELPPDFWFHHGNAAYRSGLFGRAIESAERYLSLTGQGGKQYVPVLELIDQAEVARDRSLAFTAIGERLKAIERAANFKSRSHVEKRGSDDWNVHQEMSYQTSISLDSDCRLTIRAQSEYRLQSDEFDGETRTERRSGLLEVQLSSRVPMKVESSSYQVSGRGHYWYEAGVVLEFSDDVVRSTLNNYYGETFDRVGSLIVVSLPPGNESLVRDANETFGKIGRLCSKNR